MGKELEASSEGERLAFPFVNKIYDISNAALFYAHNGRLDDAREQLTGQSRKTYQRDKAAEGKTRVTKAAQIVVFGHSSTSRTLGVQNPHGSSANSL